MHHLEIGPDDRKSDRLLASTRHVDRVFDCPATPIAILPKIVKHLRMWAPDFIVPGDIWSLQFLHGLFRSAIVKAIAPELTELLTISLGSSRSWTILSDKQQLQYLANATTGIWTPTNILVDSETEATEAAHSVQSFPVVVKQAGNSGGEGVRICRNADEVAQAFKELNRHDRRDKALRSIWSRVRSYPFMSSYGCKGSTSVQEFVSGTPYLFSFVAFEGTLLAGNIVRRAHPYAGKTSPHCRYYPAHVEGIELASRKIVQRTGFSGFGCFDFILEAESSKPMLIECNPIPVNVSHLGGSLGTDLCMALRSKVATGSYSEEPIKMNKVDGGGRPVVLFPYELMRDANSEAIYRYPEDVPFDDPGLLNAIEKRFNVTVRRGF